MKRKPKPYLMRGAPVVTKDRPTSVDPPDKRVAEVRPRKLTPEELEARAIEGGVDPRLRPIDLCFEAWAAAPGDGSSLPQIARTNMFQRGAGSSDILDEHQAKLIDRALRESPPWASTFIRLWYRSGLTIKDIAHELSIKNRQGVYQERVLVLGYFLGRLDPRDFRVRAKA